MKPLLRRVVCLGVTGLLAGAGVAQDFTLRYFELRELAHTPGVVKLSPDYQTVIEFEGLSVERVSSGRGDQIVAEVVDNMIRLRANQYIVNTDLTVTAGGKTALFRLEGETDTTAPRIYSVRDTPPAKRPAQGPPTGADLGADSSANASAEGSTEKSSTPPLTRAAEAAPEGTQFKAVVYHSGTELAIQYILTNSGGSTLFADPDRLQLTYGAVSLPYTLTRVPATADPDKLAEGASDYGTLVIEDAPQDTGQLELRWTLFREDSSEHFTLTRNLEAIPIGEPQASPINE